MIARISTKMILRVLGRHHCLPIGSGVTEAACKMIFGYRFKQSGMRWKGEQGQRVLELRVILKSGV
jgi:hypothetical protein